MANILPMEKKILAVSMLCENASIRAVERVTGVHRDTVMRLGVRVGEGCKALLDEKLRNLNTQRLEIDEMWGFIGMKQRTANTKGVEIFGNVWTWVALDADSKLVPAFATGDRSAEMCHAFIADLKGRLKNRVQITTDGLVAYIDAIKAAFGPEVDYASLVKTYSEEMPDGRRRHRNYVTGVSKRVVEGNPDEELISTSFVEKQNHTMRMHIRRLSRLTNAFSKKRENFDAAVALHFAYYNFVRTHLAVKMTPAMAAGLENEAWKVSDLIEATNA